MKAKPRGPKYRNLVSRGDVIYYKRVVGGKRLRFSLETSEWEVAARRRDLYEHQKGIGRGPVVVVEIPRLRDFAARYLAEDTAHLAETSRRDRIGQLGENGRLLSTLGERRLDAITPAVLREWWSTEIQGNQLSTKTGRAYLDSLASVFAYAQDLNLVATSPVAQFREVLRRWGRTKGGRAAAEAGRHIHPIEEPADLSRLLAAAREESFLVYVHVLLCLEAGLRLGEALGLRWGRIQWGEGDHDARRTLLIDQSRPRGGAPSETKSGRSRRVGLSRRLRDALSTLYTERFEPGPDACVLVGIEPSNFRHRAWRRVLKRADIGPRAIKDLRDTFASQLLTAGVQLGYVSQQLGHADVSVTARHYARWCGGDEYREPLTLREGEIPADLIARIAPAEWPQTGPTWKSGSSTGHSEVSDSLEEFWGERRDLNPRPPRPQPGALTN